MVSIEFVPDDEIVKEDLAMISNTAPAAALQETFFLLPVKFIIDETDLLLLPVKQEQRFVSNEQGETKVTGTGKIESIRLPLLDFTTQGFEAVKALREKSQSKYSAPGGWNLYFQKEERGIRVTSDVNGKQVLTDYNQLYRAFSKFELRVRSFLRERAPLLSKHSYWGPWFAQE